MKKYAYIFELRNLATETELQFLESSGCEIYRDSAENEKQRPYWKYMIGLLQPGDELYVLSLENAFRGVREFSFFLIHCLKNNIILTSIIDKVSTRNPEHLAVFDAIKHLTEGIHDIRQEVRVEQTVEKKKISASRKITQLKIEVSIVNMYDSGFTIDEIVKNSKYKSKASIYTVLRRNGIEPNRCHAQYKKPTHD